jgi:hypothetical protein
MEQAMTYYAGTFLSPMSYTGPDAPRWTAGKRLSVLTEIAEGKITVAVACAAYGLTEAEIEAWQTAFEVDGIGGLKAKNLHRIAKISRIQAKIDELCGAA